MEITIVERHFQIWAPFLIIKRKWFSQIQWLLIVEEINTALLASIFGVIILVTIWHIQFLDRLFGMIRVLSNRTGSLRNNVKRIWTT